MYLFQATGYASEPVVVFECDSFEDTFVLDDLEDVEDVLVVDGSNGAIMWEMSWQFRRRVFDGITSTDTAPRTPEFLFCVHELPLYTKRFMDFVQTHPITDVVIEAQDLVKIPHEALVGISEIRVTGMRRKHRKWFATWPRNRTRPNVLTDDVYMSQLRHMRIVSDVDVASCLYESY